MVMWKLHLEDSEEALAYFKSYDSAKQYAVVHLKLEEYAISKVLVSEGAFHP